MSNQIRVLLIEHHSLTLIGMRTIISAAADVEVVGEADSSEQGSIMFERLRPDVTILGLRFPDSCTIDELDNYFVSTPSAKIIVLADHAGDGEIRQALKKGAVGYICKDIESDELLKAIRAVAAGKKYIPSDIAGILSEHIGQEELTDAETKVLRMIVGGMSNKEIAFALDNSENTIKTHVQNIFGKIGVSDRTSAATTAIKRGLVRIDL